MTLKEGLKHKIQVFLVEFKILKVYKQRNFQLCVKGVGASSIIQSCGNDQHLINVKPA